MKKAILILGIFALCSCKGESIESETQGDFEVELLFEMEGCNMYRFKDGSRFVYWSSCQGTVDYQDNDKGKTSVESITYRNE